VTNGNQPPQSLDELWNLLRQSPGSHEPHLGEALVARRLIDAELLQRALNAQAQSHPHRLLGQMLVDAGVLSAAQLQQTLADWLGLRVVDARLLQPEPAALQRVPRTVAEREGVLPLMVRDDTLVIAMADPWDRRLLEELRFLCNLRVLPVGATPGTLPPAIARAWRRPPPQATPAAMPGVATPPRGLHELAAELAHAGDGGAGEAPTDVSESDNTLVRLVNRLIADAIEHRASDIHIETSEPPRPVRVRLRIDGNLVPWVELPAHSRFALVARLKIMAELDIAEHRKPQDGKIDFSRHGGPPVELRMVTVPTTRGHEDVVLRLLGGLAPLPLTQIGLLPANLEALRGVMSKSYGLILICGPTGCGKTTTLHSVMRELNTDQRKIWTAEDPVEISQPGLRQVQVNARIGWTFAAAMRTFLRADPDVIMIGEMRDEETARIAVEASLTGHLVMSTLHTNSAPESITRLLEIGLDPFMFSDSLLAVLAQRLVRRLCTACRVAEPMTETMLQTLLHQHLGSEAARSAGTGAGTNVGTNAGTSTTPDVQASAAAQAVLARWRQRHGGPDGQLRLWRGQGCAACDGSGYHGRMGLHELLVVDERLRDLVRRRAGQAELQAAGLATGMATLRQDGIEKILAGDTDLREVLAATNQ
jgi:type II secretory ATPase GspE/PulE/Tfp pilus assembly ATPase PilB-like protein